MVARAIIRSLFSGIFLTMLFSTVGYAQHMWIAGDNEIHKVDYDGQLILTSGYISYGVYRIAQDEDGNAWVTTGDSRVSRVLASGTVDCSYYSNGAEFSGVAITKDAEAWVTEGAASTHFIRKLSTSCAMVDSAYLETTPSDIVITPDDTMFVIHKNSNLMSELDSSGNVLDSHTICQSAVAMTMSNGPDGMFDNRLHVFATHLSMKFRLMTETVLY